MFPENEITDADNRIIGWMWKWGVNPQFSYKPNINRQCYDCKHVNLYVCYYIPLLNRLSQLTISHKTQNVANRQIHRQPNGGYEHCTGHFAKP